MATPIVSPEDAMVQESDLESQLRLGDLPEGCISRIISFVSPRDACRLALVSKVFKEASNSDEAWEHRLPCRYSQIIANADGGPVHCASKKELYFRLCSAILLKDGTEAYWLDRPTGEECYMLSARTLDIVWGSDTRYWLWIPREDSWFQEEAYLKQVCWLEVRGRFESIFQPGAYTVSFRIRMESPRSGVQWRRAPVKFFLSTSNGHHVESKRFLQGDQSAIDESSSKLTPVRSVDNQMEYDAGEFLVEDSEMLIELQFTMLEIEGGNWKSGLYLDGVMIRPSKILKQAPS